jgi:hypothetical protein
MRSCACGARRKARPPQAPKKEEPAPEDVEPKRDDFDTHEDYQRALTKYDATHAAREERKKAEEESRKRTEQEKQDKARDTWKGKVERAMAKHEDFEDVLEDNAETFELIANAPKRSASPRCLATSRRPRSRRSKRSSRGCTSKAQRGRGRRPDETPEAKEAREDRERDAGGRFKKKDPPEPIEPGSGRPANNSALPSDKDDPETWRRKELARMRKAQGK